MVAGRPQIVEAFTYPSTPLTQRAMPVAQMGTLVVPPLPGGSPGGWDIDVDDLLAAAVDTEFYYKPVLEQSEAESAALLRRVNEGSQSVAKLVSEL